MKTKIKSYSKLMEDKRLADWINSISSKKTRETYLSGWNRYLEYHQEVNEGATTPTKLLNTAIQDRKRPIEDRGVIEKDINAFVAWGLKKGHAPGSMRQYVTALRSFYDYYGYPLMKNKLKLPKSVKRATTKPENAKIEYRPEQVKKLLGVIKSLRDKAVALTIFQSGMDVSTAASLNYGHIKEELEAGKTPLMIRIVREKEGVLYRTFLGKDSIDAIKLYLDERRARGEEIGYDTPLFVSEGTHINKRKRMKPKNFQDNLRNYTIKAGLISKERLEKADFNPARPHALRTGFSTILKLKGVNQDIIDGFLGHADDYGGAYTQATDEELREIYAGVEQHLSTANISTVGEIEEKLRRELEKKDYVIQGLEKKVEKLEKMIEQNIGPLSFSVKVMGVALRDLLDDPGIKKKIPNITREEFLKSLENVKVISDHELRQIFK